MYVLVNYGIFFGSKPTDRWIVRLFKHRVSRVCVWVWKSSSFEIIFKNLLRPRQEFDIPSCSVVKLISSEQTINSCQFCRHSSRFIGYVLRRRDSRTGSVHTKTDLVLPSCSFRVTQCRRISNISKRVRTIRTSIHG